ncbi:hypothetical protein [Ottowia sp. VDI28]|uniref:hypothetical protein n=1 Tax=Ottowia sp. VDI28 TaxID=3133968 RepID=UPI003C3018C6
MATLEHALADFGRDIGVETLAPGSSGAVQLRFDHGAVLGLFRQGEDVVLHWAEPAPYDAPHLLWRAFKRAGDPPPGEPALQVGLHSAGGTDSLVLAVRLPERDCSARELHRLTRWLREYVAALRS